MPLNVENTWNYCDTVFDWLCVFRSKKAAISTSIFYTSISTQGSMPTRDQRKPSILFYSLLTSFIKQFFHYHTKLTDHYLVRPRPMIPDKGWITRIVCNIYCINVRIKLWRRVRAYINVRPAFLLCFSLKTLSARPPKPLQCRQPALIRWIHCTQLCRLHTRTVVATIVMLLPPKGCKKNSKFSTTKLCQ